VVKEARARVLVAKQNVGLGQKLTSENLEWQDWPEGAVRPEYVTIAANPDAITQMNGAVARFELFAGEPVQQAKLVKADQGYLSAVLDKGMRGVSIQVGAESASGGFIVPNDHVDVILTQAAAEGQTSDVIVSNVRVLAINTRLGETGTTGAPEGGGGDAATADPKSQVFSGGAIATLELTPGQADTVVNASQLGKLSLALRSIVDFAKADNQDDTRRNAPIKVIRMGQETNVMTASPTSEAGVSIDPASFKAPSVSVGATVE
jgi:pilus assembly protein CpaB